MYFLKVVEKGISDETRTDTGGHVILLGVGFLKRNYLKPFRSRHVSFKKFEILPMSVAITLGEIYDTHVEINVDMLFDINVSNL